MEHLADRARKAGWEHPQQVAVPVRADPTGNAKPVRGAVSVPVSPKRSALATTGAGPSNSSAAARSTG